MGKNNRQRRAAKAQQRRRRAVMTPPHRPHGTHGPDGTAPPPRSETDNRLREQHDALAAHELFSSLAQHAALSPPDLLPTVVGYVISDQRPQVLAAMEPLAVGEIRARLARVWEHGWQPRDLRHAAAKRNVRVASLTAAAILDQARLTGAFDRAPAEWREQLRALSADMDISTDADWRPASSGPGSGYLLAQTWTDLLLVIKLLAEALPITPLCSPPSRWGKRPEPTSTSGSGDRDRLLTKIRALLAKAEGTDHPAEAETFTAKAQELMTRHAIDEALLHRDTTERVAVSTIRVFLQAPYTSVKASLLHAVASPNRCRAVFLAEYDMCNVVGTPLDLDQVEMLFTSLLIQATRAMAEAGNRRAGSFDRSARFRKSFLTAYAARIGERLEQANRDTTAGYGAELVPVLQRQTDAVTAEFERLFPHTRSMGSGHLDRRGWDAGRDAADRARLAAGRITA